MIPKIIHTCWVGGGEKHQTHLKCIESWKKYLPEYTIKEWDDNNFKIEEAPLFVQIAYKNKIWAFVADYVRFYALYHEGGIYLDYDVEFVQSIPEELLSFDCFLATEEQGVNSEDFWLSGHVMGAIKKHSIFRKMLQFYELEILNTNWFGLPEIFTKTLINEQFIFKIKDGFKSRIENVNILNFKIFSPIYSPNDYSKDKILSETIAIHWANSWIAESPWSKIDKKLFNVNRYNENKTKNIENNLIQKSIKKYNNKKIAVLYICTGNYYILWDNFYESAKKFLLLNHEKHFFVFTDSIYLKNVYLNDKNISFIDQKKIGWPYDTLLRFEMFLKIKTELANFDYIYFFNADMIFQKEIDEKIFPDNKLNDIVCVNHPGFYNKKNSEFAYERNHLSNAFIPHNQGECYVFGAIFGAFSSAFFKMSTILNEKIKQDLSKNIIPAWHDESYLNRYVFDLNYQIKILPPSYAFPEGWLLDGFDCKILKLDKAKIVSHDFMRSKDDMVTFLKKINKEHIELNQNYNELNESIKILQQNLTQTINQLHKTQGQLDQTINQLHKTQGQLDQTINQLHKTQQYLSVQYENSSLLKIVKNRLHKKLAHQKWAKYPKPVRYFIYALKLLKMGLQKMV